MAASKKPVGVGATMEKPRAGAKSTSVPGKGGTLAPSIEALVAQERASYAGSKFTGKEDIEHLARKIAVEVSFSLADRVEELNVYNHEFRASLQRVITFTLISMYARKERCLVIPDAIPGFTLMAFKKETGPIATGAVKARSAASAAAALVEGPSSGPESKAAAMIIGKFIEASAGQVLVIECPDALFSLFPVADLKNNLRMLGFYYTE